MSKIFVRKLDFLWNLIYLILLKWRNVVYYRNARNYSVNLGREVKAIRLEIQVDHFEKIITAPLL